MEGIKAYLLSVCSTALICAIGNRFLGSRESSAGIGRLLIGSFLILTVLNPIFELNLDTFENFRLHAQTDAMLAVRRGEENTHQEMAEIIKNRTAAYILQRAQELHVNLAIEVIVSEDAIPSPKMVYLSGTVAPFAKKRLQQIIEQDLGISKECQIWT